MKTRTILLVLFCLFSTLIGLSEIKDTMKIGNHITNTVKTFGYVMDDNGLLYYMDDSDTVSVKLDRKKIKRINIPESITYNTSVNI